MLCYFLNVRKFISKSGKDCYMLTVASPDGDVSDFFISDTVYGLASETFAPFEYVELSLTASRGKFTVSGIERVDRD